MSPPTTLTTICKICFCSTNDIKTSFFPSKFNPHQPLGGGGEERERLAWTLIINRFSYVSAMIGFTYSEAWLDLWSGDWYEISYKYSESELTPLLFPTYFFTRFRSSTSQIRVSTCSTHWSCNAVNHCTFWMLRSNLYKTRSGSPSSLTAVLRWVGEAL